MTDKMIAHLGLLCDILNMSMFNGKMTETFYRAFDAAFSVSLSSALLLDLMGGCRVR